MEKDDVINEMTERERRELLRIMEEDWREDLEEGFISDVVPVKKTETVLCQQKSP